MNGYNINTPNELPPHDEEEENAIDERNSTVTMKGELVGDKEILEEKPLSRKMERRQRHEQRLERRYFRAVRGQMKQRGNKGQGYGLDDPLAGTNLVRARPARPCSYCHVPYHHKFAPFGNMKLVPW